ncbi:MAG TPA: rhodanese-like domain-containing protein [Telluria sp.]
MPTMSSKAALAAAVLALLACMPALAVEASTVAPNKQTVAGRYLDAREAWRMKQELGPRAYFIDVRTRYEVAYVGLPTVADANIPYVEHPEDAPWDDKAGRFKLDVNSDFGPEVARRLGAAGLGKDAPVLLICRSGDRSARAANLLSQLGYTAVYTVVDGFEGDAIASGDKQGQRLLNGWKNAGLPWSYNLGKARAYFPQY